MQGAGEVGRRARAVAASERGAVSYRLLLLALAAYLVWTSVNDFAPVVSRVIRWASAWFKPAAFALLVATLAWDGRGQAQRLWTGVQALVRRQALRPRPATSGDLGRDRGAPLATRGLPEASDPGGSPAPTVWAEALSTGRGAPPRTFPNPAFGARGTTRPRSAESVSLDAGVGHGAEVATPEGATREGVAPTLAGYPLALEPLLEAIVEMRDELKELQRKVDNGSASSRHMHTAVDEHSAAPPVDTRAPPSSGFSAPLEDVPPPPPPAFGSRAIPLTPPSHISRATSPVASRSPFATPDGRWELGSDLQAAMVKSVGTMVAKLPDTATYAKFKAWLSAVEDWVASHLGASQDALGPNAVRTVARLTMAPELYAVLETTGVLGAQKGGGRPRGDTTW